MIVGSLFSGIGGFDLGLERAGHTIAWQCEGGGDPNGTKVERAQWAQGVYRRSVLAHRFPGVECATDVRGVGDRQPRRRDGPSVEHEPREGWPRRNGDQARGDTRAQSRANTVDLVCGGFPCQDLSVAGRRAGLLNGSRSSLFFEYARVADALLAPGGWLLIENVPGLLSSNGGRDYAVLLATLAELGFHDLAWRVLDSRHFGVAQRRRRVYIVARRARGSRACQVLLEPTSSAGHPQTRREAGQSVAVASLSGLGSGGPDDNDGQAGRIVTIADTLTSGSHPASNMPGRRREDDTNIVAAPLEASDGHHGYSSPRGDGADNLIAHQGVRRLTPRECERLQGFPDDWTQLGDTPDSKRYAALGDAVTVTVATWIGRRIMEVAA